MPAGRNVGIAETRTLMFVLNGILADYLPTLLKIPDIRIRCMDPRYMTAVTRYLKQLAKETVPLQCTKGGPILMVQVENEYGSYGNDREYMKALQQLLKTVVSMCPLHSGRTLLIYA